MTSQYDEYDIFDDWEEDVDQTPQRQQPSKKGAAFRQQFEELLATNKRQAEMIDTFMQERQASSTKAKFESRDLDPQAVGLMPQGLSAADQDKWLDQWAAVLPKRQQQQAPGQQTSAGQPAMTEQQAIQHEIASTLTPSELAALQATTEDANQAGQPPTGAQDPLAKMQSIQSEDDFWRYVRSQS